MKNYHQITEQHFKNFFQLTDNDIAKFLANMPPPTIHQYIEHKAGIYKSSIEGPEFNAKKLQIDKDYWKERYNIIRGENWPECQTIKDFYNLPKNIQDECTYVHKFSPNIWFNQNLTFDTWTELKDWTYGIIDLIRFNYILFENLEYIKNKSIVDFSTHLGFNSALCLFHGAKDVTFTEVREPLLELCKERMELMEYTNYKAILADIHNYALNTEITQSADTVFLSGILYHVHDHYSIIESVTKGNPTTIIIETKHHNVDIIESDRPLVYWAEEETKKNTWNGWYNNLPRILVGSPNLKWFEITMKFFGYQEIKRKVYKTCEDIEKIETNPTPTEVRSVQIFNKINKS